MNCEFRSFQLHRHEDESGVSGTGIVAKGAQFQDGQCCLWWENTGSIAIYRNVETLLAIHGHGGKTELVWS